MSIRRQGLFALVLVLAVLLTFFPVCGFDFLDFDDRLHVLKNPLVRDFSLNSFLEFWRRPREGLYIPLTYTVWGMLAKISGAGGGLLPAPFHTANLLLHAATAASLYFLLRLLVKDDWAAAGGALFFALHPLVVESVAWVSELKGLLSGFLSILALRQYLRYGARAESVPHWPACRDYWLATLLFVAALLAKPSALVLPLLAGLLAYFCQSRPVRDLLRELSPWILVALPLAIVTKLSQPDSQFPFVPDYWQRLLVAGYSLGFYFIKLLWPFNLTPDYGLTPSLVLSGKALSLTGLLPWFLLGAALLKKARPWLIVVAIPFCALLPVLGLIPFSFQGTSTVADRYTYLALAGPALGVAVLLARYRGMAVRWAALSVLAGLAVISQLQLSHWRDSPTLDAYILKVNPGSWIAHHSLGVYYQDQHRLPEAIYQYKETIKLQPGYYPSYYNLAYLLAVAGDFAGAVEYCEKFVRLRPDYVAVYTSLGDQLLRQNRLAEAAALYEKAVALRPDSVDWRVALAEIYKKAGRQQEAEAALARAMGYGSPQDPTRERP